MCPLRDRDHPPGQSLNGPFTAQDGLESAAGRAEVPLRAGLAGSSIGTTTAVEHPCEDENEGREKGEHPSVRPRAEPLNRRESQTHPWEKAPQEFRWPFPIAAKAQHQGEQKGDGGPAKMRRSKGPNNQANEQPRRQERATFAKPQAAHEEPLLCIFHTERVVGEAVEGVGAASQPVQAPPKGGGRPGNGAGLQAWRRNFTAVP